MGAVFFSFMGLTYIRGMQLELTNSVATIAWSKMSVLGWALVAVASFAAFGAQALGLMDLSAPASPFSSIRVHGGSNHLVMPTGLLEQWASQHPDGLLASTSLGGGIVRVEYTDSAWLNSLHPGEHSSALPARVVSVLQQGGHLGRQYNPSPRRVLGPEIRSLMPRWNPGNGPFPRYTVPALEIRRLVTMLRKSGSNFSLIYTHLKRALGDEVWRASGEGRRVEYNVSGAVEHCSVDGRPCANELVQQPEPDLLSWKTRVFFPYPILGEAGSELPCMD